MSMARMPTVALLSGGTATRLQPITKHIPKAMVEVAGEPFIAHQLRLLSRQRIEKVVLCCGHLHDQIERFVGNGSRFGIEVVFSLDAPAPLGTGGALCHARPLLGDEFLVMYGDSYLDLDFAPVVAAFRGSDAAGLMTVFSNMNRWDTSNVLYRDGRILAHKKGHQRRKNATHRLRPQLLSRRSP